MRVGVVGASDVGELHSGKWTHEESEYVKELIKEFEAGSLSIEENISLRRFLSKALNCSPKRISKKFEGTLYNGKQLYKRKTSALTPEQVAAKRAKLREMERKYKESLKVLQMVEASRKPTSASGTTATATVNTSGSTSSSSTSTSMAQSHKFPLGLQALPGTSIMPLSACVSREARIAKLKADIALASMALGETANQSSSQTLIPSSVAAVSLALSAQHNRQRHLQWLQHQELALLRGTLGASTHMTTTVPFVLSSPLPVALGGIGRANTPEQGHIDTCTILGKRGATREAGTVSDATGRLLDAPADTSTTAPSFKRFKHHL
ncbi:expressed unknown protein [Seminavis robusta]|uniref:Uncharacterized protein n=1 Tax=Seminavis robusta TaxID=568900 RepID=A0A9N8DTS3_9STRA|nr:expressed unknown protein [Seminavis robusta]|eukprot:Sro270_g104290.1 n/a (323) ;mRNA; r:51492-52460